MKKNRMIAGFIAGAVMLCSATAASATEELVNGSMSGTSTSVAAPPSCAPLTRLSTLTGSGSSSQGAFDYTHTVCLSGPGPITNGTFTLDFGAGNTIFGSVDGHAATTTTLGLFDLDLFYDILGGTGQYVGASGLFNGVGDVDQRTPGITSVSLTFSSVPEPATWTMMVLGMGAIGGAMRRRKAAQMIVRQLS